MELIHYHFIAMESLSFLPIEQTRQDAFLPKSLLICPFFAPFIPS